MFGRVVDYKVKKENYCLLTDNNFKITWEIKEKITPENENNLVCYEYPFLNKKIGNINICTPSWNTYKLTPFNIVTKYVETEFKWISFMIENKEVVVFKYWSGSNFPKIEIKIELVS